MSFDQCSHENNSVKILHEILKLSFDQRNLIPIDIMDRLPSATDTSVRDDLSRIKFYRNIIVHCDSALVDDTDFESYWKDVTPVIHNYFHYGNMTYQISQKTYH
jgi:hypothetical protein